MLLEGWFGLSALGVWPFPAMVGVSKTTQREVGLAMPPASARVGRCASNVVRIEEQRCRVFRLAVVVVVVLFALGSTAAADPAPPPPACEKRCVDPNIRTLKEHTFILPAQIDTAFVATHFGILLGVSYQRITPKSPATVDVHDLAGLSIALRFAYRFLPWLGMFVAGRGQVGAGVTKDAAYSRGGRAIGDWEVGLAGRILRLEGFGTQLGIRLKAIGRHSLGVIPVSAVEDIIDDILTAATTTQLTGIETDNIMSTENSLGFSGVITAAQAINSHFGLQASVDGGVLSTSYGIEYEANETGADSTRFRVGAGIAATADVMPYFPLGIMVEYRFRSRFEETKWFETEDFGSTNHIVGGGLFYTGRRALVLGLVAFWRHWAGEAETREMVNAQLMMQYFF